MKTRFTYIASALISLLLCAAMLCGAVLPATAEEATLPSLDYYNPNIESTASLSGYELYTALIDKAPTTGEMLYWQQSDLALQYTDFLPDSCINTQYDGERGVLDITLLPYSYQAANGAAITWIPKQLSLEGQTYEVIAHEGFYTAHIENCFYSGDFNMQVDYTCQVEIPREIISVLRHEAYQKGYDAYLLMEEYYKKLRVYEALVEMQNKWDAYEKWEEDYANYLVEKAIYDELKKEYDAYMVEYNAYLVVADAYNQWQNYFAEQETYPARQQAYVDYMNYYKVYKAAVDKLAMFESIFKKESRGWCMYNDIMGNAVTEVLSKQDLLIAAGGNKEDILLAGVATENLRVLLKGYADLRNGKWKSDHEKYKALYTYYTQNYDALKQNFCDLYKTLKGLYGNTAVSNFIGLKGKTAHYRQLVGHLFVISTCLDQSSDRNESAWRIDNLKLLEVIEDIHHFADGDWDPKNTAYPATEVPYAENVEMPKEPTVAYPPKPTPPPEVKNPGEPPRVVEDPSGTPRPDVPKPIGEKPQRPDFDAAVEQLYQEVESGVLKPFEEYVYPEMLTLTNTVKHQISIKNLKVVTFYNPDGSVYKQLSVDYGANIDKKELKDFPFRETPEHTYEWYGWYLLMPDGNDVEVKDTMLVTENLSLYPHYNATKKVYYITWIVDGVSNTVPYYYGVTPDPNGFISHIPREEQYYRYEFSGWTPEITPVTSDATYEGWTVCVPKTFQVTWVIKNGTESITELWEYNQVPVFAGDLSYTDEYYIYSHQGWDKNISPVTRSITYTAVYKKTPLATGGLNISMQVIQNDTEVRVLATEASIQLEQAARLADEAGKTLTVYWAGKLSISMSPQELKNFIACGCPAINLYTEQKGDATVYQFEYAKVIGNTAVLPQVTVQFEHIQEDIRETVFEVQSDNDWLRLDDATYVANGAFVARCRYAYNMLPEPNKFCNVTPLYDKAVPGDWISLKLNCVYGYKVVGATVTDADGNEIPLEGLSFQMPASVVNIVLEVERIVYRVTFLVNGEVWHSAEYFAGDELILPEEPPKRIEGEYAYTFIGWGNVPAIVMGEEEELVFEASFAESKIVNDYDTGNNNNVLVTVVLPIVGAVVVLLIAFLILWRIVRKKGGWRQFGAKIKFVFTKIIPIKVKSMVKRIFKKSKTPPKESIQKKK